MSAEDPRGEHIARTEASLNTLVQQIVGMGDISSDVYPDPTERYVQGLNELLYSLPREVTSVSVAVRVPGVVQTAGQARDRFALGHFDEAAFLRVQLSTLPNVHNTGDAIEAVLTIPAPKRFAALSPYFPDDTELDDEGDEKVQDGLTLFAVTRDPMLIVNRDGTYPPDEDIEVPTFFTVPLKYVAKDGIKLNTTTTPLTPLPQVRIL